MGQQQNQASAQQKQSTGKLLASIDRVKESPKGEELFVDKLDRLERFDRPPEKPSFDSSKTQYNRLQIRRK